MTQFIVTEHIGQFHTLGASTIDGLLHLKLGPVRVPARSVAGEGVSAVQYAIERDECCQLVLLEISIT